MKTKKAFINLITDVIPLIIVSILGIFKFKLFIQILGDETLGLYQLFTQVMVYVALIDGGLSSAVLYSLYKPNVEKDNTKFNALIAGAFKSFSLIGAAVFGVAFLASFIVPFLIKGNSFSYVYIIITFLLFSLSNVISYFFVPYHCLLEVKERKYIVNLSLQIGQIVQSTLEIIMLLCRVPFLIILLMHSIIKLLSNIVIAYISKKRYPEAFVNKGKPDMSFTKNVKHLLFHKVNGLVCSNIDIILISRFLGLTSVAIYSAYNYIINMFKNILGKISGSLLAIIGNELVKGSKKSYELFKELNSMLFFLATIICVPLSLAINQFIDIWYEGKIVTNCMIAASFTAILFLYIVKMATNIFVNSKGLFKETRYCALTDTIVNLILSLTLIKIIGIPGVLIATAISVFIAEYIMKTVVIYKNIFNIKPWKHFISNTKFFVIYILDTLLGFYIISQFAITNIFTWFGIFIIYTVFNSLLILLLYRLMNETLFINRIKIIFKREKSHEKNIDTAK